MKKYRNLRKNPLPRIGKGFFDFYLSSTNKSNTACQTSVSVPTMILVLLAVSYEIKADNRKLAAESSKTVTQSETKSLLP